MTKLGFWYTHFLSAVFVCIEKIFVQFINENDIKSCFFKAEIQKTGA